jgi:von Willebrand factor type A domain
MPSFADLARRAVSLPRGSLLVLATASVLASACPADPGADGGGAGGFGGVAAVGGSGGAATGGSGAFGGSGGVGASGGTGALGGSGGVGAAGTGGTSGMDCGGDAYGAEPRQLDIYVVMDKSYSMIFPTDLWGPTTSALNQFFMSPQSAGIGVGIQYFANECSPAFYETPETPISPLPGNAGPLQASMAGVTAVLGTATTPALTGAITHARNRQTAMPDTKQIVLLVTDGEPAGCMSNIDNAAMAAGNGFTGSPSIPVYVLGLGNITNLNRIAQSGGTGNALLADPTNPQAVIDAMNAIRGQALPCDYAIPATTGTFDSTLVNVKHVLGGNETLIFGVGDVGACDPTLGGWYYDNPITPTRVFACPATCAALGNGGEVKVVVGCMTQRPPE